MSQGTLFDAPPSESSLGRLVASWRAACERKEAIPYRNREARIEADAAAFAIEREIVAELDGRTPAVLYYRGEWYALSGHMILKAEFINLEEEA